MKIHVSIAKACLAIAPEDPMSRYSIAGVHVVKQGGDCYVEATDGKRMLRLNSVPDDGDKDMKFTIPYKDFEYLTKMASSLKSNNLRYFTITDSLDGKTFIGNVNGQERHYDKYDGQWPNTDSVIKMADEAITPHDGAFEFVLNLDTAKALLDTSRNLGVKDIMVTLKASACTFSDGYIRIKSAMKWDLGERGIMLAMPISEPKDVEREYEPIPKAKPEQEKKPEPEPKPKADPMPPTQTKQVGAGMTLKITQPPMLKGWRTIPDSSVKGGYRFERVGA